jgi:hypothetical protein
MKNTFSYTFNSGLDNRTDCDVVINSINKLIKYETAARSVSYAQLKALLKNIDHSVVVNNAYRRNNSGLDDFDLYIDNATTINIYWGLSIYVYAYKDGDKYNKSGFSFVVEKFIDPSSTDKLPDVTGLEPAEVRTVKEPVVKEAEVKKPESEMHTVTKLSKMRDYFIMNEIFAGCFNKFIDESIGSLTDNLEDVIGGVNSFNSKSLSGLTNDEIEDYVKPFTNLMTLIRIDEPESTVFMIKSAFNAMLLAHMDAKLNGYDEDLHIEYNVNSK